MIHHLVWFHPSLGNYMNALNELISLYKKVEVQFSMTILVVKFSFFGKNETSQSLWVLF